MEENKLIKHRASRGHERPVAYCLPPYCLNSRTHAHAHDPVPLLVFNTQVEHDQWEKKRTGSRVKGPRNKGGR